MSYYTNAGQMDLTDRIAIETGICRGEWFKQIARRIRRHPSTVAHKVKENRTRIGATYCAGKDCRHAKQCAVKQLCGAEPYACDRLCKYVFWDSVCQRIQSQTISKGGAA